MGGRFALDYAVTYADGLRSLVVIDGGSAAGSGRGSGSALRADCDAGRKRDVAEAKPVASALRSARAKPEVGPRA